MPRQTNVQIRRGSSTDWTSVNPTLAQGELAFETDTKKVKVGDGTTAYNSLQYVRFDGGSLDEGTPQPGPTTTTTTTTTAAPTTTTTAAPTTTTTTAAPSGKVFSNVSVIGGGGEVSGAGTDTLILTRTNNGLQCKVMFTIPAGTVTITKPNRANAYGYLVSATSMGIAGQQQEKDGSYLIFFPSLSAPANSTVSQNTSSGFSGEWEGNMPQVGESVTFTIS